MKNIARILAVCVLALLAFWLVRPASAFIQGPAGAQTALDHQSAVVNPGGSAPGSIQPEAVKGEYDRLDETVRPEALIGLVASLVIAFVVWSSVFLLSRREPGKG